MRLGTRAPLPYLPLPSSRGKGLTCQGRHSAGHSRQTPDLSCNSADTPSKGRYVPQASPWTLSPPRGAPRALLACLRVRWRGPAGPAAGSPGGACARSRCCPPGSRSQCQRTSAGHALPLGPSLHISDKPSKGDKKWDRAKCHLTAGEVSQGLSTAVTSPRGESNRSHPAPSPLPVRVISFTYCPGVCGTFQRKNIVGKGESESCWIYLGLDTKEIWIENALPWVMNIFISRCGF